MRGTFEAGIEMRFRRAGWQAAGCAKRGLLASLAPQRRAVVEIRMITPVSVTPQEPQAPGLDDRDLALAPPMTKPYTVNHHDPPSDLAVSRGADQGRVPEAGVCERVTLGEDRGASGLGYQAADASVAFPDDEFVGLAAVPAARVVSRV